MQHIKYKMGKRIQSVPSKECSWEIVETFEAEIISPRIFLGMWNFLAFVERRKVMVALRNWYFLKQSYHYQLETQKQKSVQFGSEFKLLGYYKKSVLHR